MIIRLFIILTTLSSCSVNSLLKKTNNRSISSTDPTCNELVKGIISVSPKKNKLRTRSFRAGKIRSAMEIGDMEEVISLLKKSHDNTSGELNAGSVLNGRSFKLDKLLSRYRNKNKSLYVPAFYQTMKNQEIDTLSTVLHVTDDTIKFSSTEQAAIEDVLRWVSHYEKYWERMAEEVRAANRGRLYREKIKIRIFRITD